MAKLYFRYGAVGSAKTMNLLAVAHSYEQQGKRILLLKPELDVRFGAQRIRSRSGLEKEAHVLINEDTRLDRLDLEGVSCVLVDEAQFLSEKIIEGLRDIATKRGVPVICYGLRTDFKRRLFEGSRRLLELADALEEVKMTCHYCNRKAIFNLKLVGGKAVSEGPQIELGTEEKYLPACPECYDRQISG